MSSGIMALQRLYQLPAFPTRASGKLGTPSHLQPDAHFPSSGLPPGPALVLI